MPFAKRTRLMMVRLSVNLWVFMFFTLTFDFTGGRYTTVVITSLIPKANSCILGLLFLEVTG